MDRLKPMSRLMYISGVLRVLRAAAPEHDWRAQRQLEAHLKRLAGNGSPERKRGRILSTSVLLNAGIRLAGPQADAAATELEEAKRRRDGAMIAMLALLPMRRRAFAALRLGHSVHVTETELLVTLTEEMTKTGVPWEAPVPPQITPLLRRYLTEVRPWLMARRAYAHDYFWVGDWGAPYELTNLGGKIARITTRITGVRVPMHFFRDSAATTLARISPKSVGLIPPVLAHSGFRTAERHYVQAGSIEAGRDYAAVIRRMKRDGR
jgi:integrase